MAAITVSSTYVSIGAAVSKFIDQNLFPATSPSYLSKMLSRISQGQEAHLKYWLCGPPQWLLINGNEVI
jgi:hypothetical protein